MTLQQLIEHLMSLSIRWYNEQPDKYARQLGSLDEIVEFGGGRRRRIQVMVTDPGEWVIDGEASGPVAPMLALHGEGA